MLEKLVFNRNLFLWREDIEKSILLYKVGGDKVFLLKGSIKSDFIILLEKGTCSHIKDKNLKFFLDNFIFLTNERTI